MTNDHDPTATDDRSLDDRIRTGLHALVDEAPTPPDLDARSTAAAGRSSWSATRRRPIAAAAVSILIAATAAVIWWPTDATESVRTATPEEADDPDHADSPASDRPFFDTQWMLESAVLDGEPTEIPNGRERPTIQFVERHECDGNCHPPSGRPAFFLHDGCNGVSGSMEVDGDTVTPTSFGSTAVGCEGPNFTPLVGAADGMASFTYEVTGETLILRFGAGSMLTYRATDGHFPETTGTVIDEGSLPGPGGGEVHHRVAWEQETDGGESFFLELRGASGTSAVGAVDDGAINAMKQQAGDVDGRDILFGLVPGATTRTVYEPTGGDPIELELTDLPSTDRHRAVVALVPGGVSAWQLVAYDADGTELHRLRWG